MGRSTVMRWDMKGTQRFFFIFAVTTPTISSFYLSSSTSSISVTARYGGSDGAFPRFSSPNEFRHRLDDSVDEKSYDIDHLRSDTVRLIDARQNVRVGNEMYKKGHFVVAHTVYDKAISMSPENAAYRSNRAAALTAMGRLREALLECKETVRLDPVYGRAHQRVNLHEIGKRWRIGGFCCCCLV